MVLSHNQRGFVKGFPALFPAFLADTGGFPLFFLPFFSFPLPERGAEDAQGVFFRPREIFFPFSNKKMTKRPKSVTIQTEKTPEEKSGPRSAVRRVWRSGGPEKGVLMKKAVLIGENAEKFHAVYPAETIRRIRETADAEPVLYRKADVLAAPEAFADTAVLFSTWGMPRFTEEEIRRYFPRLECVFYAAGSVQGFARPFLSCGVRVFSAWAANAVPVAEYTVAQILLSCKGFFAQTRQMKEQTPGRHALKAAYPGNYGEKIGLIGCGMIGSLVSGMLQGHRLEVLVYDPYLSRERADQLKVTPCTLEQLFSSCRVVSNHLPNNESTRAMLNYRLFSRMLPYATFLNTGRGAQVVEADLAKILAERPDLTALLDVTDPEPPLPDSPFFTLQNCWLTPHIAGSLGRERVRMSEYMTEEWLRYLDGAPCRYEVTPAMLETMA